MLMCGEEEKVGSRDENQIPAEYFLKEYLGHQN
jgi:hypothetical protein